MEYYFLLVTEKLLGLASPCLKNPYKLLWKLSVRKLTNQRMWFIAQAQHAEWDRGACPPLIDQMSNSDVHSSLSCVLLLILLTSAPCSRVFYLKINSNIFEEKRLTTWISGIFFCTFTLRDERYEQSIQK